MSEFAINRCVNCAHRVHMVMAGVLNGSKVCHTKKSHAVTPHSLVCTGQVGSTDLRR